MESGPTESNVVAPAPWDDPELLPHKPETGEYGWRFHGRSHPCTREELIERCRSTGKQYVELVWTPETNGHVPPADVPWLIEPLRDRARDDLRYNLRIDAAVLLLGILYIWYTYQRSRGNIVVPPVYLAIFLLFVIVPAAQDVWALSRLRRSFGYLAEQAASLRYSVWLGTRRIVATYFVAVALLAVWAAQIAIGTLQSLLAPDVSASIKIAGLEKEVVHQGQWWRLLTAEMLHGHWLHFGMNVLSLLAVGRLVEVHAGPVYVSTVFLFSALCASLASLYLSPAQTSVGASGAIMGLIGFLAVMGYRRRHVLPRGFMKSISFSIALTAGAGLVAHEVVDNAAHFGGLLGGALLGFIYLGRRGADADDGVAAYRMIPSVPARIAGVLSGLVLLGTACFTIWLMVQSRLKGIGPTP